MAGKIVVESGNTELDEKINQWLSWDKNEKTTSEVIGLIKDSQWSKLSSVMMGRLAFGTAGLRGRMEAGFSCMNDLVVLQSAQGLCEYLKKAASADSLTAGIVVGFDGRYNSERFAQLTAKVFASAGITVCLFSRMCPTPWVSFAVKLLGAAAGVMVTASHNPKEDNGYKVYWGNGAQIIYPHDANIEEAIKNNLEVPSAHWVVEDIYSHPLVSDQLDHVTKEYLRRLRSSISADQDRDIADAKINFTYSAMHGVGYTYVEQAFAYMGLQPLVVVEEQRDPDPEFSTVLFPNPEEPSSLELSIRCAEQNGCSILLANDPDADRLAIAEYQIGSSSWHILSGNEIGALLGWWCLQNVLAGEPAVSHSSLVLMSSAVSSKMLRAIATMHGATFIETLTGFKWMGNQADKMWKRRQRTVFAFEEAIGFMCGMEVPDKDGVSAAVHAASLCSHLLQQGRGLMDQLDWLYSQYGFHITLNSYFVCHRKDIVSRIFQNLRDYKGSGKYPDALRDWPIESVRDLGLRGDELAEAGTGLDCTLSSGEMLTLTFCNGLVATIRTSGTEPKVKYYTEMCAKPGQSNMQELDNLLSEMVTALIEDFLRPEENGLIARK